jgi:cobalt/nickel transport system permease protein
MAVEFLDRYARGSTVCHRMSARLKIVMTLATILAGIILPISLWPIHGCLACLLFAAHTVAEIPVSYLARRLLIFLPLVGFMALAAPLSHVLHSGWDIAGGIIVRSLLAFLAALWLVNTTPFEKLLEALSRMGMPRIFVSLLAFTYRYVFVIFDELARMRTAQRARTFGGRGPWGVWKSTVQLVAMLLIRSLNRAERVHFAMLARGWQGEARSLG